MPNTMACNTYSWVYARNCEKLHTLSQKLWIDKSALKKWEYIGLRWMTYRTHRSISIGQLVQRGFKAEEWSMALFYLEKCMQPYSFFFFLKVLHICYLFLSRDTATNLTFLLILHRRDNVRFRCQPDNLVLKKYITNPGKILYPKALCFHSYWPSH